MSNPDTRTRHRLPTGFARQLARFARRLPRTSRPSPPRRVCLALQGGGSHGAFTWGVIERLLEQPGLRITAVSGASAGALNAVALATGIAHGGRQGGRKALEALWDAVSGNAASQGVASMLFGMLPYMGSPYQFNPIGANPLGSMLERVLDLDALTHRRAPRVVISATNVHTGATRLFGNAEIGTDALLASACLPQLFHAIEIDGEHYWDGGYAMNPPLLPIARRRYGGQLVLVQLTPIRRESFPRTSREIESRGRELAFNAGLMRELETIAQMPAWQRALLPPMHRITAGEMLAGMPADSALDTSPGFLQELRAAGHEHAGRWLAGHGNRLPWSGTLNPRHHAPRGGD